MSMRGKIYSAVAVLVIVAVVIGGVAIRGILSINENVQALGRQAKRAVNISTIDSITLSPGKTPSSASSSPQPPNSGRSSSRESPPPKSI